jgi:hypothetical protein
MNDILVAQKMARRLLASKKVEGMRQGRAALNIQRIYRGHQGRVWASDLHMYRENERATHRAATNIQRSWRGYAQQQKYWSTIAYNVQIQSAVRGMLVREQLAREHAAATKIQTIARGRFAQIAYMVYQAKRIAAIMIQTSWRGFLCYTDYIFTLGDVLTVQKIARRYIACKKVSALRQQKAELDSAVAIQRTWRGHAQQQRYWYLLGCTLQIQRAVRGIMVRDRLAKEHAAAIEIQRAARRSLAITMYNNRRIMLMELAATGTLEQHEMAVRKIEAWWFEQMVRTEEDARREEEAVLLLQNWSRRRSLAAKLQNYAVKTFAAEIIQHWWRMVLLYQCEREDEAATSIQLQWRLWRARMARKKILREQYEAARTIQRFFLMVKAMVDREIRAEKKRRKRKKMYKKFHTPAMEDALLETIWTNTVETPRRSGSTSKRPSVPRPQSENAPSDAVPPRRGRSSRRLSQLASEVSKDLDMDDASVTSHHTAGSSIYHVAPPRRSTLSRKDLDEDIALEEAWIDTEINFMKERSSSMRRSSSKKKRYSSRGMR